MAEPARPGGGPKVAGVPVWVLVAVLVVGALYLYRRQQAAAAAAAAAPASASFPVPPSSQGIGAGGITSTGGAGTGAFPDNNAWYSSALATLEALGYDANSAASALSAYLSGGALNTASQGLVNIVLARIGPPPVAPSPSSPSPPVSGAPPPAAVGPPPPSGRVPPGYVGDPYRSFAAQLAAVAQGPSPPQGATGSQPTSPLGQCPPGWYFDPISQSCQPLNPQLGATGGNPPPGSTAPEPVPTGAYQGGVPFVPSPFAGINPGGAIKGYTPPPPPPPGRGSYSGGVPA